MTATAGQIATVLMPFAENKLEAIMRIEQLCYSHPWTRGHFLDAQRSGYRMELLALADGAEHPIGYCVAMAGFEETHLLNLTIAPEHRRQGWAKLLMHQLGEWSRAHQAQRTWLEVRASNESAQQLYEALGFVQTGVRKGYYPQGHGQREDAIVMCRTETATEKVSA